ncbi:MAG: pilus assembly protein PilV [Sterolibacterium sp.]|nr:pilus assembly protein PilV [Sterolibacterium sp.]
MTRYPPRLSRQTGSMLLEALIAILIFSMGILAIVGMQAAAVKASSDAKYRSDASMVANQLIGQMWAGDRTPATMQTNYQGSAGAGGAAYTAWLADVQAALPGAAANPPTVTVSLVVTNLPTNPVTTVTTSLVTVTVRWLAPGEPGTATPHSYTVVAQIA